MDSFSPVPTPAPSVPEMHQVPPAPQAAPAMPVTQPMYSQGGGIMSSSKSSFGSFFDGITLLDVGMITLVTIALLTTITYYRKQIIALKTNKSQDRQDIDELKSNVQSMMGPNYKPF